MIKVINHKTMGKSERGWLHSIFHFSFAEYYNPQNMHFGPLRVVNDDIIDPQSGFDTHTHKNMEIVSYVVDGKLSHKDSMNNEHVLERGQVQYMSAGTGVFHSEHNRTDDNLRFLQIWILPDADGYKPQYGDFRFDWSERENKWLQIVSGESGNAPIHIHQDMNISVIALDQGKKIEYDVAQGRQAYVIQIEGSSTLNNDRLGAKDAAEVTKESKLQFIANEQSHIILFDMPAA